MTFTQLSVRNMANWSPAVSETDLLQEWQTLLRLLGIVTGLGPTRTSRPWTTPWP